MVIEERDGQVKHLSTKYKNKFLIWFSDETRRFAQMDESNISTHVAVLMTTVWGDSNIVCLQACD